MLARWWYWHGIRDSHYVWVEGHTRMCDGVYSVDELIRWMVPVKGVH